METIPAKTIVSRSKNSAWFGAEYNMNIYRGCSHGCIYCDSRSSCYGTEEFDRIRVKENALEIIRNDLRRKVKSGVVATGSMSDPYNPREAELGLTRRALELIHAYEFGVAIATKSDLLLRDADILREIAEHSPVLCKITITTCDDRLCKKIEGGAAPSSKRFDALRVLSGQGIYAGVLLMPVLPFLEDSPENILGIVNQAAAAGARFIYPAFGMTLRDIQRDWYFQKLEELFPGRRLPEKYLRTFGNAYQCTSPRAKELWNLFKKECDSLGLLYRMTDIIRGYRQGYGDMQLSFRV